MHAFDPSAIAGNTRGEIGSLDYVDGLPGLVFHPRPAVVPHGAPVLVSGWTVDPATDGPPLAVVVLLDRSRPLPARSGIARGDVMVAHKTDEFVGYQLVVQTGDLEPGAHELRPYSLAADGFWYESEAVGFRLYRKIFPGTEVHARALRMDLTGAMNINTGKSIPAGTPVRANHWLSFRGWAVDPLTRRGVAAVMVSDAQGRSWSGPANLERPDVHGALQSIDARVGFEVPVPAAAFRRGRHDLQISGFDAAGRGYANAIRATVDIIAADRPFPLTARVNRTPPRHAVQLGTADSAGADPDIKEDAPAETTVLSGGNAVTVSAGDRDLRDGLGFGRRRSRRGRSVRRARRALGQPAAAAPSGALRPARARERHC